MSDGFVRGIRAYTVYPFSRKDGTDVRPVLMGVTGQLWHKAELSAVCPKDPISHTRLSRRRMATIGGSRYLHLYHDYRYRVKKEDFLTARRHILDGEDCMCGIYIVKDRLYPAFQYYLAELAKFRASQVVVADVIGWGATAEYEHGFRVEHARIERIQVAETFGICYEPEEVFPVESFARFYDIPLVEERRLDDLVDREVIRKKLEELKL